MKKKEELENKDFDDLIRDKLSEIEDKHSASDWDTFASLLNNQPDFDLNDDSTDQFDQQIVERLANAELPYNPQHWSSLVDRLHREDHLRKHIITIKTIEGLFVLLLILSGINLGFFGEHIKTNKTIEIANIVLDQPHLPVMSLASTVTDLIEESGDKESIKTNYNEVIAVHGAIRKEEPIALFDTKKIKSQETPGPTLPIINEAKGLVAVASLPLTKTPLLLDKHDVDIDIPYEYLPDLNGKTKQSVIVSGKGGSSIFYAAEAKGLDRVHLATDPTYGIDLLKQWQKGRWGIITGLQYSSIRNDVVYNRDSYETIDGDIYRIDLNRQKYDVLSVPARLSYDLISRAKSRWSIAGGASTNFILRSEYDKRKTLIARGSSVNNERNPIINSTHKDFVEGIEQGGNFTENMYMTASLGLMYQRNITKIMSLVCGITYDRYIQFDGLGPNDDKYDLVSTSIGIKVDLDRN